MMRKTPKALGLAALAVFSIGCGGRYEPYTTIRTPVIEVRSFDADKKARMLSKMDYMEPDGRTTFEHHRSWFEPDYWISTCKDRQAVSHVPILDKWGGYVSAWYTEVPGSELSVVRDLSPGQTPYAAMERAYFAPDSDRWSRSHGSFYQRAVLHLPPKTPIPTKEACEAGYYDTKR